MKKLIPIICLLLVSLSTMAQTDYSAKLKEDLVKVENGNYSIDDTQRLTFENGASIQYQTTARGPQAVLSRDVFIDIYSSAGTFILISILSEAGVSIDEVKLKELDEPIGVPEIKVHFEMTKDGMQMAVTTEDGTERETMTWQEFFEEN